MATTRMSSPPRISFMSCACGHNWIAMPSPARSLSTPLRTLRPKIGPQSSLHRGSTSAAQPKAHRKPTSPHLSSIGRWQRSIEVSVANVEDANPLRRRAPLVRLSRRNWYCQSLQWVTLDGQLQPLVSHDHASNLSRPISAVLIVSVDPLRFLPDCHTSRLSTFSWQLIFLGRLHFCSSAGDDPLLMKHLTTVHIICAMHVLAIFTPLTSKGARSWLFHSLCHTSSVNAHTSLQTNRLPLRVIGAWPPSPFGNPSLKSQTPSSPLLSPSEMLRAPQTTASTRPYCTLSIDSTPRIHPKVFELLFHLQFGGGCPSAL